MVKITRLGRTALTLIHFTVVGGCVPFFKWQEMVVEALVMKITRCGRTALSCYSVIMIDRGCIPFIKRQVMVVEGVKNTKTQY